MKGGQSLSIASPRQEARRWDVAKATRQTPLCFGRVTPARPARRFARASCPQRRRCRWTSGSTSPWLWMWLPIVWTSFSAASSKRSTVVMPRRFRRGWRRSLRTLQIPARAAAWELECAPGVRRTVCTTTGLLPPCACGTPPCLPRTAGFRRTPSRRRTPTTWSAVSDSSRAATTSRRTPRSDSTGRTTCSSSTSWSWPTIPGSRSRLDTASRCRARSFSTERRPSSSRRTRRPSLSCPPTVP
mmetsp:Transcript_11270/g.47289  ORF Transcript_11270/g.47289 Transcript_11270/m.47289 type:complete len:243 (+) Transcript_11270:1677-2405(+)